MPYDAFKNNWCYTPLLTSSVLPAFPQSLRFRRGFPRLTHQSPFLSQHPNSVYMYIQHNQPVDPLESSASCAEAICFGTQTVIHLHLSIYCTSCPCEQQLTTGRSASPFPFFDPPASSNVKSFARGTFQHFHLESSGYQRILLLLGCSPGSFSGSLGPEESTAESC